MSMLHPYHNLLVCRNKPSVQDHTYGFFDHKLQLLLTLSFHHLT